MIRTPYEKWRITYNRILTQPITIDHHNASLFASLIASNHLECRKLRPDHITIQLTLPSNFEGDIQIV